MIYSIEALDSLFFRSAAPFEARGETNLVESLFPPLPGTYAGAVKPYLGMNPDTKQHKRLRISYNGILLDDEVCFPQPLDTVATVAQEPHIFNLETMTLEKKPISNFPLEHYLTLGRNLAEKIEQKNDIYVKKSDFIPYLAGKSKKTEGFKLSDYLTKEVKLGIEIDSASKTAREKHIYQIQTVYPQKRLKLAFETNDISIDGSAFIKLGGEGKSAVVSTTNVSLQTEADPSESKYFKLYFATPAIFEKGWLPHWINPESKEGIFKYNNKSIKVNLIAAAVGRYIPVGGYGYELETRGGRKGRSYHPKEMRYAIPAGSVYYFKILDKNKNFQDAKKLFHQKCISDYREGRSYGFKKEMPIYSRMVYCDRGFGYALVGSLSKKQEEKVK